MVAKACSIAPYCATSSGMAISAESPCASGSTRVLACSLRHVTASSAPRARHARAQPKAMLCSLEMPTTRPLRPVSRISGRMSSRTPGRGQLELDRLGEDDANRVTDGHVVEDGRLIVDWDDGDRIVGVLDDQPSIRLIHLLYSKGDVPRARKSCDRFAARGT